ncbi:DUF805 domain-containing protein [Ancylomarina sp. 16SWW S1-10-2]|uniref:DUF805 domain-containing protein n=1 Tax=Ancylomarina sp. 16SWW S1-10-2 TaxID=2499681 RepID=UPI0012AD355C|nr:DUF805 domain-containing protein [Ancylomarina sp. 16SWW S1-10-2]MRT94879.1 DUF805 domain-containing protein [Ancylomarina sp. 16SWW S1-10-2]
MNWYLKVLKKYFSFSGRACRREYWFFRLFNLYFIVNAVVIDNTFLRGLVDAPFGIFSLLYICGIVIPNLAVSVRRLHDISKSGWLVFIELIPVIGLVWFYILMATKGSSEPNQYGTAPVRQSKQASPQDETTKAAIFIPSIWSMLTFLLVVVAPSISGYLSFDLFSSHIFSILGIFAKSLGLIVPVYIARLIKSEQKQLVLYVFSVMLMLFVLFDTVYSNYFQF